MVLFPATGHISLKNNSKFNKLSAYLSCLGGKKKFKPLDKSAFSLSFRAALEKLKITFSGLFLGGTL